MAYEIPNPQLSLNAGADHSSNQFRAVKVDSNGNIVLCGAAESGIGVLQDNPTSGNAGMVWMYGVTKAVFGGTVARGASVTTDANGRFVTAGGGDPVWGVALVGGSTSTAGTVALASRGSISGTARAGGNIIAIPLNLSTLTANQDYMTITPGFVGTISRVQFVTAVPASTAAKAATINLKIAGTLVTGGSVALTTATVTANSVIAGSAVTANNTFSAVQAITVNTSGVTAFVEGTGSLLISVV